MPVKSPEEQLEDFRYDAKLFKQAYKAGLKAKEIEKKRKRDKRLYILGSIVTSILLFLLVSFLINSQLFRKKTYLEVNSVQKVFVSNDINIRPSKISKESFDSKFIDAKAALYADLKTGKILYSKNSKEKLSIASLTKLMSAVIILKNFDLDEVLEVQEDWYDKEDMEWSLGLDKGDKVSVETLLKAMLISSYNDSAYILANHFDGGIEAFVEEMNNYAQILGLYDTVFNNPSGLDNNGGNISTTHDLYKLATVIYKNDFIMSTITKSYADLKWDIGEDRIYTTNALIGRYGNIGGKTGYTELSDGCFLGITNDDRVTIVLGSKNRFDETEKMLTNL